MSKDVIFEDKKPARAVYYNPLIPTTRQFPDPKDILLDWQVDLNDYRRVSENELLKKDDIYKSHKGWAKTLRKGDEAGNSQTYWRKKIEDKKKINPLTHRMVFPSEIVLEDDEFWNGVRWQKSGNAGAVAGTIYEYRRKINDVPLFTDEELERAANHYLKHE
jgi:hypothetical protein